MISPIRYEVEIQEPLSTPVPIPPSMLSSEALVIWMFRIAMKAPIMAASTAIQVVRLARSEPADRTALGRGASGEADGAGFDMACSLGRPALGNLVRLAGHCWGARLFGT